MSTVRLELAYHKQLGKEDCPQATRLALVTCETALLTGLACYQQPVAEHAPGGSLQRRREDSLREVDEVTGGFETSQTAGHLRDQQLPLKLLEKRYGRVRERLDPLDREPLFRGEAGVSFQGQRAPNTGDDGGQSVQLRRQPAVDRYVGDTQQAAGSQGRVDPSAGPSACPARWTERTPSLRRRRIGHPAQPAGCRLG